jgi:membrane-associated phospholipid phosphatase
LFEKLELNVELFRLIHHSLFGTPLGEVFVACQTPAGVVCLSLLALISSPKRHGRAEVVLRVLLGVAIGFALSSLVKQLVPAPRPASLFPGLVISTEGVDARHGHSMPSGHTTTAFAIAGAILALWPRWWIVVLAFLIATSVGLGRIVLGVHFPLDVLAGAILGGVSGWLPGFGIDAWRAPEGLEPAGVPPPPEPATS